MDDLVETLAIGLFISLILIVISWWFWKRYDEPSEAQIEREESIAKKEQETQMWRAVEAQMAQEKAALNEQALYEQRKADERARAQPPPVGEVSNAFAAFDMQTTPTFAEQQASASEAPLMPFEQELELEENDDDVHLVELPVEVRQDQGFAFEETVIIPSAPDLDALIDPSPQTTPEVEDSFVEVAPQDTDWSDSWFQNLEEE
tara:strand:- start:1421 stop:2032 length:612 start_codon:yes stop_codon:yes gene_type:complete